MMENIQSAFLYRESEQVSELYDAFVLAQGNYKPVKFDQTATIKNYKYSYASLPAMLDAVRQAHLANGLFVHFPAYVDESGRVFVTTRLGHKSGQWMECTISHTPTDYKGDLALGIKEMGGEISYLSRYGMRSLLGIVGEEDNKEQRDEDAKHISSTSEKVTVVKKGMLRTKDPMKSAKQAHPAKVQQSNKSQIRQPDSLIAFLEKDAVTKNNPNAGEKLLTDTRKSAAIAIKCLTGDDDELRHTFQKRVFDKDSLTQWSLGEMVAVMVWIKKSGDKPSPRAKAEFDLLMSEQLPATAPKPDDWFEDADLSDAQPQRQTIEATDIIPPNNYNE